MKKEVVVTSKKIKSQHRDLILTTEDKKKLTDFFSILIEIDRRTNITGAYDKKIN